MMRFAWFPALKGVRAAGVACPQWVKSCLSALLFALFIGSWVAPAWAQPLLPAAQVYETGVQSDLSINGPGYFVLLDPVSGQFLVTRFGQFNVDPSGYLVSTMGYRVQGYTDNTLTNIGDLQIISLEDTAPVESYVFENNGLLCVQLADGIRTICGQVLLQNFTAPSRLSRYEERNYSWDAAAGPLLKLLPPDGAGLGTIRPATLEVPNASLQLSHVTAPPSPLAQGFLHSTGVSTDVGIQGDGFFILRDTNSGALFATRCGAFLFDPDGWLVNYAGLRVQGFNTDSFSDPGDIRLPFMGEVPGYQILNSGMIEARWSDGTSETVGQILLRQCASSNLPPRLDFSLFPLNTNSSTWTPFAAPNAAGLGHLAQGFIEVSQYDPPTVNARRLLKQFPMGVIESIPQQPTCLAINGAGFFILRDPITGAFSATRQGNFQLDGAGHLVATNGCRLQGLTDMALSTPGDLTMNTLEKPPGAAADAVVDSLVIRYDGTCQLTLSEGTTYVRAQLTLQYFRNLQTLRSADGIFFTNLAAAGPLFTNATPCTVGLGGVVSEALEQIPPVQLPELNLLPQTGFRLLVNDVANSPTCIQASADLVHWTSIGAVDVNNLDQGELFDTNAPATARFYRISN